MNATDKLEALGAFPSPQQIDDFVREEMSEYFAKQLNPHAKDRDHDYQSIPRSAIEFAAEVGVLQYLLPKSVGGSGGNRRTYGMILEAIGYYCEEIEYPSMLSIYGDLPNLLHDTEDQALIERYVVPAARGELLMTFAYTEREDNYNFQTRAVQRGDRWVLNGHKVAQTGGALCDVFLVYARDEADDLQLFIVERGDPGVEVKQAKTLGFRAAGMTSLTLTDVDLPASRCLVHRDGLGHVQYFLNDRRLFIICAWPGRMKAMIESLVLFLSQRIRHKHPLTDTQSVRSLLGHMNIRQMSARAVLHDALERSAKPDHNPVFDPVSTAAKFTVAETAIAVANDAIRLTGWAGYSDELPYHRYLRAFMGAIAGQGSQEYIKILLGHSVIAQVETQQYKVNKS